MNIIAKLLITSLTSFLLKLMTSFATDVIFEHVMFSILKAGAKSTKTEWDDELVKKLEEVYNKQEGKL